MNDNQKRDNQKFRIAIIGLGLIGGSVAYALQGFRNAQIVGYDIDSDTLMQAFEAKAIDKRASSVIEAVSNADISIFCSAPSSLMANIKTCLPHFKKGSFVTEICGVKRGVVHFMENELPNGVDYVGIHPMAGKAVGGFVNAASDLFQGAGFIIVPPKRANHQAVKLANELASYMGAGRIELNDAATHDNIIAYTSDLMHIASAALCESFPDHMTLAHTAGAFKDCTRIACIDASLWTELLMGNSDNTLEYLDAYIAQLHEFRDALESGDNTKLHNFLQTSSKNSTSIAKL